jgi:hypothetical protein
MSFSFYSLKEVSPGRRSSSKRKRKGRASRERRWFNETGHSIEINPAKKLELDQSDLHEY